MSAGVLILSSVGESGDPLRANFIWVIADVGMVVTVVFAAFCATTSVKWVVVNVIFNIVIAIFALLFPRFIWVVIQGLSIYRLYT